jgi:hypothetical protein
MKHGKEGLDDIDGGVDVGIGLIEGKKEKSVIKVENQIYILYKKRLIVKLYLENNIC